MKPDIYNYNEPTSFLRDALVDKQQRNPSFSARAWARQMGFKGHSLLNFFLNGHRPVKPKHLSKVCKGLDFTDRERRYFEALVHFTAADSPSEKEVYESWLKEFHPHHQFSYVELEKFRSISNWIHMAVLEMTELKDFKADPKWIEKRLGKKASVYQIQDAIDRLIALGLLQEKDDALCKTHQRLTTPKDRPSQAIREHHKQVLALATQAIDEQDVSIRDYNSCTMTIDSTKLEKAKELIQEFRSKMAKHLETKNGDETYQLSVQFFRLTHIEKENQK